MTAIIKAKFPLLLLGIVFLASVSVSFGFAYWEEESPRHGKCVRSCSNENDAYRYRACHSRCKLTKDPVERRRDGGKEQEQEEEQPRRREREPSRREREREGEEGDPPEPQHRAREREQEGEREQERRHKEQQREERERGRGREVEEEEEGQWRGRRRREDPEERARERQREEERREQRREVEEERQREARERRKERQREERERRREKREQQEEREGKGSRSQKNPYHFSSKRFQTRYENEHGHIRVLQRFDQRSEQLRNLQNYRVLEFQTKPNTLILPHHSDAEYLLVVLRGKAIITVVNPNNRDSYNVERGDVLRIPAGTTAYLANPDDDQNLRVVKLAIPVNKPGQFEDFFPSGSQQNPQSYFSSFSRETLEATFNTQYEEIQRILLGEERQQQPQQQHGGREKQPSQEEGVIVKVSKEQIKELSQHAQSSSRRLIPSESGPFNLRSRQPRYSNEFGKFYEVTPEKNPQLQDLGISITCTEINKGGLMLPHFNSEAIVVAVVGEGKGNLEMVGLRERIEEREEEEEEEEEQKERNREVQRITAKLSQGDVFIIPAGYPIALNASSDLHVLGFGLNAENNQRNFLGGEKDNVINQIERQVKELAFAGSGEDVERLIKKLGESHFANAQPQLLREGRQGRRGPLSSILGALH